MDLWNGLMVRSGHLGVEGRRVSIARVENANPAIHAQHRNLLIIPNETSGHDDASSPWKCREKHASMGIQKRDVALKCCTQEPQAVAAQCNVANARVVYLSAPECDTRCVLNADNAIGLPQSYQACFAVCVPSLFDMCVGVRNDVAAGKPASGTHA